MESSWSRLHRSLGRRPWRLAVFAGAFVLNIGLLSGLALRDSRDLQAVPSTAAPFVIFADITPRPVARRLDSAPELQAEQISGPPDEEEEEGVASPGIATSSGPPAAPDDDVQDMWRVRPSTTERGIAEGLRAGAVGCANRSLLSMAERERCDQRFQANAPHIAGTGDRDRDARFARQGARELAAYEARRAAPAARTPCEQGGPISDCGVEINVEIFSTIDGFFPNLRGDD